MSSGISVCVIACDEEEQLPRCLEAVAWADEIIVIVDAGSSDGTEQIAREHTSHVERHVYLGDIEQKRRCVEQATHEWVLIIDPDEVVTSDLATSIRRAVEGAEETCDGFLLNRITYHLGRWIRHGDFYPDWKLRLFRPAHASWVGRNPHGRIQVEGRVDRISGELRHYSYRDLADQISRIQFFSGEAAAALRAEGHVPRIQDLVLRPPARFLRAYLLKLGFLDAFPGFAIAAATAFSVFLKYAKLWELVRVDKSGSDPI
jgi:glycosyltransferase involved in cell wall biosynthesis